MNVEIESQILCQEEIEKFRRLYEIVDEDDIEEVKLERALFLFCGRRLPSIDACRREKSRVDTVEVLTSNIMRSCFFNLSLMISFIFIFSCTRVNVHVLHIYIRPLIHCLQTK